MISLRTWSVLALGVAGFGAACSPAVSEDPLLNGSSGGQVGTLGSGGNQVATGNSGGATGNPGSGGATGGPSGGATGVSSGGAPIGTASGGAAAGTAIECTGTAFGVANGYVDNGVLCGYGYSASWDDATVMPADFEGATELCGSGASGGPEVEGTGPYPGFEIGFGLKQHKSEAGNESSWMVSGTGLTIAFTATGATGDGAVVLKLGIPGTTAESYQIRLTAAEAASGSVTKTWSAFSTEPWEGGAGTSPAVGTALSQLAIQVRGTDVAQTVTSLCITDVTVN